MLAFTFPGQGSQRSGMGHAWVEHPSWEVVAEASDIAGRDLANPLALIRFAIMMLYHLGKDEVAERVRAALRQVIVVDRVRTHDLGGDATTTHFTGAVVAAIEAGTAQ